MNILFVGDLSSYARARQRFLALQDLGHTVVGLSWVPLETELEPNFKPPLWQRVFRKAGYPVDVMGLNPRLEPAIAQHRSDLLWIEKANTIFPSTYRSLKRNFPHLKIVYYCEDDIYLRDNRSEYLRRSLSLFDMVYTTKPRNVDELPTLGAQHVFCIFQAYDRNVHRPLVLSPQDQERWGADVGFVGFFERDRAEHMLFLAQHGIKVRVWGFNWHVWPHTHPNLILEGKPVHNEDFIKVLNATRINLNFLRKINRDQHTSRSLEIPACRGFMLAERTQEHLQLFEEGQEAEFFASPQELLAKVQYYLAHEDQRQHIARAGCDRCQSSGYSHHDRLKVMLDELGMYKSKPPSQNRLAIEIAATETKPASAG